jgi:hypothetical protein
MTSWMSQGRRNTRGGSGRNQLFRAKWNSKCSVCGKKIVIGEYIGSYGKGTGACHKLCAQGGEG